MEIPLYLAMTAAEFSSCDPLPQHPAWMSCRFSPSGKGLCNLPSTLPEGTLLIIDDQTPPDGHDAFLIRRQLEEILNSYRCAGLLLDFQRPDSMETAKIAKTLLSLPCPVCVSHLYAEDPSCPVFAPPCPLTTPMEQHLAPWQGREIWLEVASDSADYRIHKNGCQIRPASQEALPFYDEKLFCHYGIRIEPEQILFTLERKRTDLDILLVSAAACGVTRTVGLFQELCP
jgi:hypothetical protein